MQVNLTLMKTRRLRSEEADYAKEEGSLNDWWVVSINFLKYIYCICFLWVCVWCTQHVFSVQTHTFNEKGAAVMHSWDVALWGNFILVSNPPAALAIKAFSHQLDTLHTWTLRLCLQYTVICAVFSFFPPSVSVFAFCAPRKSIRRLQKIQMLRICVSVASSAGWE